MTRTLYMLDDSPVWAGYRTGETWNGWECPCFDRATVQDIADWYETIEHTTFVWEGNILVITYADSDDVWRVGPDTNGRYSIGWTWWPFDIDAAREEYEYLTG